jgi:hypothetical protein
VGNVVGAGAELAAGCDLRVGGDNLHLAWAGARLGVPVGPARLAPLVGCTPETRYRLVDRDRVCTPVMPGGCATSLSHARQWAQEGWQPR